MFKMNIKEFVTKNKNLIKYSKIENGVAKIICTSDDNEFKLIDKALFYNFSYIYETICRSDKEGDVILIY